MKRLFTEVNYSLDVLLNQIKLGVIGLPDIQRHPATICLAKFEGV